MNEAFWIVTGAGAFCLAVLLMVAVTADWAPEQPVPARRGPSLRYSAEDDGSPEWLHEYFARLDGE